MDPFNISSAFCVSVQCSQSAFRPVRGPKCGKLDMWCPCIKKVGKNFVKNHHSVSLLPALCKILERVVVARVTYYLERHHFLYSRQFGFRQGRSAADLHLLLRQTCTCYWPLTSVLLWTKVKPLLSWHFFSYISDTIAPVGFLWKQRWTAFCPLFDVGF